MDGLDWIARVLRIAVSQHALIFEPRWISSTRNSGAIGNRRYYSTESLPNQATLSVLSSYLPWIPIIRCHTHWKAACIYDKIRSITGTIQFGSCSWKRERLYSWEGLGVCCDNNLYCYWCVFLLFIFLIFFTFDSFWPWSKLDFCIIWLCGLTVIKFLNKKRDFFSLNFILWVS